MSDRLKKRRQERHKAEGKTCSGSSSTSYYTPVTYASYNGCDVQGCHGKSGADLYHWHCGYCKDIVSEWEKGRRVNCDSCSAEITARKKYREAGTEYPNGSIPYIHVKGQGMVNINETRKRDKYDIHNRPGLDLLRPKPV
tara:strand:- start:3920 stop:4339 length:420 start_codon:yes stop_codon:yes gene_type:complete